MRDLELAWHFVSVAHGGIGPHGIDLHRPPALGRQKEFWPHYINSLIPLLKRAGVVDAGFRIDVGPDGTGRYLVREEVGGNRT